MTARKKKRNKGHRTVPSQPRRNRKHAEAVSWSGGRGRLDDVLGRILWILFELVLASVVVAQTLAAIGDRDTAADFASAPTCQGQPISAAEDCRSWQDLTVIATSAQSGKGGTEYRIAAGSYVVTFFDSAPDWIKHVAKGQQVEMLVWKGNPEGLRGASGEVEYTEDPAPGRYLGHVAAAGLAASGMFVSLILALFLFDLPAKGGRRRFATYTGLAWAGVAVLAFAFMVSSGTEAVRGLLIGLAAGTCFAGLVVLLASRLRHGRRRGERRTEPEPADAVPDLDT